MLVQLHTHQCFSFLMFFGRFISFRFFCHDFSSLEITPVCLFPPICCWCIENALFSLVCCSDAWLSKKWCMLYECILGMWVSVGRWVLHGDLSMLRLTSCTLPFLPLEELQSCQWSCFVTQRVPNKTSVVFGLFLHPTDSIPHLKMEEDKGQCFCVSRD